MNSLFKSNLPEDFDVAKRYKPILTELEKEDLRKQREASGWYEKIIARSQDPEWLKRNKLQIEEITSRSEWLEKNLIQNRELVKDKEWVKWRAEQNSAYWNTEEGKIHRSDLSKKNWENNYESMSKALKDRYADGNLSKKISESLKNSEACKANGKRNRKPMMTPDGAFPSRVEAALFYKKDKSVMNGRMAKYPKEYYYISQEEYIMLTGKDIV